MRPAMMSLISKIVAPKASPNGAAAVVVDGACVVVDVVVVSGATVVGATVVPSSGSTVAGASIVVSTTSVVVVDVTGSVVVVVLDAAVAAGALTVLAEPHALSASPNAMARAPRLLGNRTVCNVGNVFRAGLGKQFDDFFIEFVNHAAQRKNVENTLAALEKIDYFFAAPDQRWLASVDDEVGSSDVFAKFVLEVREDFANLFEADAGVEEVLHNFEFEQVAVAVLTTRAAASSIAQRWTNQVGASPVVELTVGDSHDFGRLLTAVSNVCICVLCHYSISSTNYVREITMA